MMKQILYILLGIMLLSIVSCYDDEGNYDYHDINEVTFGEINTMYNVLLNIDTLKIDVGDFVEMSKGDLTDTDRFEYLWVRFFSFTDKREGWLQPQTAIEVKGDLDLSVYNDKLNVSCKISEMSEYVKPQFNPNN